jgi:arabinose-5-phosphate isomerase
MPSAETKVISRDSGLPHAGPGDLAAARRVLRFAGEALAALSQSLDGAFSQALDLLMAVSGRVIVSGMGKSGHVGRKIAATFSSTGTPAQFVHPSEASHGDLGALTRADALLMLSNSGETAELSDLITYAKRHGIALIGVAGKRESALISASDVALVLPKAQEACPMGLAPTTSTTLMLALGDALAVALLERKGFSHRDYHALHPGGKLGRKLLEVIDLMHREDAVPLVTAGTMMSEAIIVMTQKSFGCVGVLDARRRLIGIVTDGDLRRHMGDEMLRTPVETIMSGHPRTIRPHALAFEALGLMNALSITSLFAVDEERKPLGILHIHDCLRAGIA